jgi:hypothetical protein
MMKHWTQTRAGKKRLAEMTRKAWITRHAKNGAPPPEHDEFQVMGQILELFEKLPQRGKDYIKQRIA